MLHMLALSLVTVFAQTKQVEFGYMEISRPPRTTKFTITVENVSTDKTLKLSNGTTASALTAAVLWAVHTESDPIFTLRMRDRGRGLESLAEEGDPAALAKSLRKQQGIVAVGAADKPKGEILPGAITPGKKYEFSFSADPGQRLTLAMMFGQSNDLFYAPESRGILLFDATGRPAMGDMTSLLSLWDAGTEVNQEPGLGRDQAPRQKGRNTGADERSVVRAARDKYTYPKVSGVIRVTITPEDAIS